MVGTNLIRMREGSQAKRVMIRVGFSILFTFVSVIRAPRCSSDAVGGAMMLITGLPGSIAANGTRR